VKNFTALFGIQCGINTLFHNFGLINPLKQGVVSENGKYRTKPYVERALKGVFFSAAELCWRTACSTLEKLAEIGSLPKLSATSATVRSSSSANMTAFSLNSAS
jgi:hypothetical protein